METAICILFDRWSPVGPRFAGRIGAALWGAALLCLVFDPAAHSRPAHAHEGESHDDKPPEIGASLSPRMVAHSDQLELVAIAGNDELTVYLDDARDNRPVSGVKLALEAEGGTTVARQIEDGLYRIKAEWLRKAGTHDLVFSIASENVNDLLIGELDIPATATSGIGGGEVAAPRFLGISARWLSNGAWLLLGIAATLLLTVSGRLITTVVAVPALASISVIVVISFSSGRLGAGDPATPAIVAASAVERPKRLPSGALFVPKITQRLISVRTTRTKKTETTATLRVVGRIIPDPNASGRVQPSVSGRIEPASSGIPYLGQIVKRGQILAYVRPIVEIADRINIQDQLGDLRQQIALVDQKLQRVRRLKGTVAQRVIDDARIELRELRRRHSSIAPTLAKRDSLQASADGAIAAVNVVAGQIVEAKDIAFEIVDRRRLWVHAIAFDDAMLDDIISASAVTNDGESLRLSYLGRGPALIQQAIPLHFRIEEMSRSRSIGTPVNVLIRTRRRISGLVLPKLAVVRAANGQSLVWEHEEAELFVPHPVTVEQRDGKTVLVLSGLAPDLRVVSHGAELLNQIR